MEEDRQTLEEYLREAKRQLAAAEGELRAARKRVRDWRNVVFGLKSLVDGPSEPSSCGVITFNDDDRSSLEDSEGGSRPLFSVKRPGASRRPSTTDQAVEVLADAGRPMQMKEIREEWERRGWIKESWKAPASSINMAYQRALKQGLVGRMADGSWVLSVDAQAELEAGTGE